MLRKTKTLVYRTVQPLLDVLYPPVCLSCNELLPSEERHLCGRCWRSLERAEPSHALYQLMRSRLIAEGFIDELLSCYMFVVDGPFQRLAHALKYDGFTSIGERLGEEIATELVIRNIDVDLLIPVPLHRRKERERGYNQSEIIARGISSVTKIPIRMDVIRRKRDTQTQTTLNSEERKHNVHGAFEVKPEAVRYLRHARCVLVDDIMTTGATLQACAAEIHKAGATKIIAVTAALAE